MPSAPGPLITARALRRATTPRPVRHRQPLPLAQRFSLHAGDIAGLDVDAIGVVATTHRSPATKPTAMTTPGGIRARWLLEAGADTIAATDDTDSLARLVRGFLKRAASVGADSFGLPDFAPGMVGASAQGIARVVVRESRTWCSINAQPGLIVFNLRDPGLFSAYRDLIGVAA